MNLLGFEILSVLTHNLPVGGDVDLVKIARSTPGFVGADLEDLVNEACRFAMERVQNDREAKFSKETTNGDDDNWTDDELKEQFITMNDFEESVKAVQPSSKREGIFDIPNVTWDDVGGYSLLKQEFDDYIVGRVKFPEEYKGFGLDPETGFLLYGPPGCGKTLVAQAVANESGANFIHIKGPELLNKYVGESESAVRTIFRCARTCSPCIIFFDEIDAWTTKRGTEGGWVVERPLIQLLLELDGGEPRPGVYVIGATNRPDVIDPAVLRSGRLGKHLYVPPPTPDERGMSLKVHARDKPIDADVDLMALVKDSACENFSGADLKTLMEEAAMAALRERLKLIKENEKQNSPCRSSDMPRAIKNEIALEKVSRTASDKQIQHCNLLSESFEGVREKI